MAALSTLLLLSIAAPQLSGEVRDARAGDGVPGIEVNAYVWSSADAAGSPGAIVDRASARTDAEGRFELPDLAPGPVTLSLFDPATERSLASRSGAHPADEPDIWSFAVDVGPTVPLAIEAEGPFRAEDWRVRIVTEGPGGGEEPWAWRPVNAGEDGGAPWARWAFVDGATGPDAAPRVEVQRRGLERVGSAPLPRAAGTLRGLVRVPTEARGAVAGVVRVGGEPSAGVWITTVDPRGAVRHARTDGEGRVEIRGLVPGAVRLVAHAAARAPEVVDAAVAAGGTTGVDVALPPPGEASIVVELGEGAPVPALLVLDAEGGEGGWPLVTRSAGLLPTLDPRLAIFRDLPEGTYVLRAWSRDGRSWRPVPVRAPGTAPLGAPDGGASPLASLLPSPVEPPETVRLHLRDAEGAYDPRDFGAYAVSLERRPPVAGARVVAADGAAWTSDEQGVVELPRSATSGGLAIEVEGRRVFPSPGFADGRVRIAASDVVVWLHPTARPAHVEPR